MGQQGRGTIAGPRQQNPGEREYKLLSCFAHSFCNSTWSSHRCQETTPHLIRSALSTHEAEKTSGPPSVPSCKSSLVPQHEMAYKQNHVEGFNRDSLLLALAQQQIYFGAQRSRDSRETTVPYQKSEILMMIMLKVEQQTRAKQ